MRDSATVRLTFFLLWVSDTDMKVATAPRPASRARSRPTRFGTRAQKVTPSAEGRRRTTSAASASWGIQRGRTKELTSMSV